MESLKNKTILLTGASSGLGKALLFALLNKGARVAFCGRSAEKMEQILASVSKDKQQNIYHETFCLSEHKRIVQFVQNAKQKFGSIDVLINNAGLNNARGSVLEMDMEKLDWMMKINFMAPAVFMQEAGKLMMQQHSGLVVNMLSTACLFSNEGIGAYTAGKAALDALTKVFRKEVRTSNIRTLSVYPGGIDTPFRNSKKPEYMDASKVADLVIQNIETDSTIALDELVFRPLVERNF